MDFVDQVKAFASTIPSKLESIKTEEATKQFLVMPFVQQVLGYDTFNPNEVMPEYDANVGAAKKFKLDYAIFQDGEPAILIECKCYGNGCEKDTEWSQLFAYFSATDARIGVLTDGVNYNFYADLEKPNRMDKTPFLKLNLLNLSESEIRELSKLTKSSFVLEDAMTAASELKYVGGIKALLKEQTDVPKDDFVEYFFRQLCPDNNFYGRLKSDFIGYTQRGIKEFIREEIENLLDEAAGRSKQKQEVTEPEEEEKELDQKSSKLNFTDDEREAYYILKAILSQDVDASRITHRDTQSYCNVLLDDNGRRPIVRLHFNNPDHKRLELFSMDREGNKSSEFVNIENLDKIYKYTDSFRAIVAAYENPKIDG